MHASPTPAPGSPPAHSPRAGAPALVVRGLRKSFRRKGLPPLHAVDGIDLEVPTGQILAFLGPNGAGKTTAIDMVLGLTTPTEGTVTVLGTDPRAAVRAGKVSAVLQTGGLLGDLSVRDTVRLIASTFAAARPVDEVLARAGLAGLADRRVSKCSGGEQQRLRFALALLPDPELLILDEPTAGMDVAARHAFWDTMRADADAGRTVIFATHYLAEAEEFAQRIVLIDAGRIVADGSVDEIRARGAGRTISADLPADLSFDAADGAAVARYLDRIRAVPGVTGVRAASGRVVVTAADTDAAALVLLRDLGATGLEIAPATLDSAFLALTGNSATETSSAAIDPTETTP